jgi:hypothetical protein
VFFAGDSLAAFGYLESDRRCQIAQGRVGGKFDGNIRQDNAKLSLNQSFDRLANGFSQRV